MKKLNKLTLLVSFCLIFWAGGISLLSGQVINARLTTSAYTWQQQESDSTSADHLRAYQLAQISVGQLGSKNISFHTYMYFSTDILEEANDDPRFWLYNCYLNWRKIADAVDLSLGRQRIYGGVGYGTFDGLQVKYDFKDIFRLKLYGGSLVSRSNFDNDQSFDFDKLSWGFHLTTRKLRKTFIGISFAQKSLTPVKYTTPGVFTEAYRMDNPVDIYQQKLIGLDVSTDLVPKLRINGRFDYSIDAEEVKRSEFGGRYKLMENLEVGAEYIYRYPTLYQNSIFSVFPHESNQEYSFLAAYRLNTVNLTLNVSQVSFKGDDAQRIRFGCNWGVYYVGYFHRAGYSGDSDGLSLSVNYPVQKNLSVNLGSTFSSYQLSYEDAETEQALAAVLGVAYQPLKTLTLQANAQMLKNMYFDRDVRFYFRGSYAFMHRLK